MSFEQNPDWERLHFQDSLIFDLHAHPGLNISLFNRALTKRFYPSARAFDPFSVRTNYPRLKTGGVDILLSVQYAPERGIVRECPPLNSLRYLMPRTWKKIYERPYFEVINTLLDEMEKSIATSIDPATGKPMARLATSLSELDAILTQSGEKPIAFIHCVEGGHAIDGKLENLEALFNRGVAYMTLAHFFENEIVHPTFPWPEYMQKSNWFQGKSNNIALGLKPFGEQVVEKMVEMGMIIDISHCTSSARSRIFEIVGSRAPLMATHVGAFEINPDPYNLKDWEIKKIAESGGIVGIIFMNYWTMPHETGRGLNFISRTLDHFIKVGGIDHVGIGSDFDGFTDPPDDLKDASELPRMTQRLLAEGYTREQMIKIWGGNALRVLREGWKRN